MFIIINYVLCPNILYETILANSQEGIKGPPHKKDATYLKKYAYKFLVKGPITQ